MQWGSIKFMFALMLICFAAFAQNKYTHADSLKGKITKEREWWNVLHYDLHVSFQPKDSTIAGHNKMFFLAVETGKILQIDLLEPMKLDSAMFADKKCVLRKDESAYFVSLPEEIKSGSRNFITFYFHGKPIAAKLPPWDGGLVWKKDVKGNPWISIACQGMAARVWFPNKDHGYDEPDSVSFHITVSEDLTAVSNGRLRSITTNTNGTKTYNWAVVNPINNYNIIPYIGKYVNFKDTLNGKAGVLDLDFWVLEYDLEKAKKHFAEVKPMLRCFEDWFGPYPFYEDGYKLVEAPYLGMEHQSAVAYGNFFLKGYMGRDLSNTGWGLKWDFIIVHESGHEWFGNNITTKDVADSWVHEGFTSYSENLYTECLFGKEAGADYVIGTRSSIENIEPLIADYDVNKDGPIDKYYKGANLLHTIRQIVNNDSLWKGMLRSMNRTFWHQTVTSQQVEDYMSYYLKIDLSKVFDQYLRTVKVPMFEYKLKNGVLSFRWVNCVKGFEMPLRIKTSSSELVIKPGVEWRKMKLNASEITIDRNFYVNKIQRK